MQDFKKANEAAEEARQQATKVEEYMPFVRDLLAAVDEALGAAEPECHGDVGGVWIPLDLWGDVKRACERAW